MSITVTVKLHETTWEELSPAAKETTVSPTGNSEPDTGPPV